MLQGVTISKKKIKLISGSSIVKNGKRKLFCKTQIELHFFINFPVTDGKKKENSLSKVKRTRKLFENGKSFLMTLESDFLPSKVNKFLLDR
jgi:hypothetical protein